MSTVKVRYKQAGLGAAWAVRQPLVATVLGIVLGRFLRVALREVRAGYHPGDSTTPEASCPSVAPYARSCATGIVDHAGSLAPSWPFPA